MDEGGRGPLTVVDIVVPEDELAKRLSGRRICSACGANADPSSRATTCAACGGALATRADDTPEVVLERLRVYQVQTAPVLDYYRARPTFRAINGAQMPDRVAEEVSAVVDEVSPSAASRDRERVG